ncbi:hypothetical protein BDN72DRAFT_963198 [Pluteus cervinus]|uniref:Uncharacterized protein n=1 Tax=Pluteus cervinus TaxID=181527 RepID=A0ACD3AG10_9AGAR|nr:hypothetical protein BDN72DRAFT_963198 [Pluteus cervinus]
MSSIWAKGDPEVHLTFENLFETAYPQNYLPHLTDSRNLLITQDEADQITSSIFQHPALDLQSIFQDSRLSGLVPSKDDRTAIQTFLRECQDDIQLLDTKIKDAISTIAQLSRDLTQTSAQMVQKTSQVRLCEYLLSSHRILPQDVLEEVFLACLETNAGDPTPIPTCPPLQLAAVCHRWRTIALSMPTLWNGLHLTSASVSEVQLAKTWASRCYLPSLTLEFDKLGDIESESSAMLYGLLDTLQGASRSPRDIDLIGLGGPLGSMVQKFILERDQPALEELVLRDFDRALHSLPKASTSLRRIYTHKPPESWRTSPPPSQLTVLWLTSKIHCTTLVMFLANCPNLRSLYVDIREDGLRLAPEQLISRDIIVPGLTYLGLWDGYYDGEPPKDLLQGITFPSLRVVEYCVSKRSQDSTLWLGLIHALNSTHRLTLQFHDALPSLDSFTRMLEHAPNISELSISTNTRFMPDIIISLASMRSHLANQSTVSTLSCLRTLYLDVAFNPLTDWLSLQPQLTEFGRTWTSSQSSALGPNTTPSLCELVIQHRFSVYVNAKDRNEAWKCPEVKQALQSACPSLRVRIVCVENISWLGDVPASFGMFPLPFNGVHVHGAMEDDDTWTNREQPIHQVMS